MSQATTVIADSDGATVIAEINGANATLLSNSSGAAAPATPVAIQFWGDLTNSLLKIRDIGNASWITVGDLTKAFLGNAQLAVAQLWTKNQRPYYTNSDTASGGGTFSYDGNTKGQVCLITTTTAGALTFAAPANIVEGSPYTFIIKEGDALARTYAYNAAFKNSSQMPATSTGVNGAQSCWNFIGGAGNTLIYNVPVGS